MAVLAIPSGQTFFDRFGQLAPGTQILFFDAASTTPKTVYQGANLQTPHPRPVLTNALGMVPPVYVGVGLYKVRVLTPKGELLIEYDGIQGEVPAPIIPEPPDLTGTTIPTAFMIPGYTDAVVQGWVRANGRSIGDTGSGASEMANSAAMALFLHLWNADESLEVAGGRGVSAEADWSARKRINLPDLRGRTIAGRDNMGNGASGRLTNPTFPGADTVGSAAGAQTVTLTVAQMPEHTHSGKTDEQGVHRHEAETDNKGEHTHTFPSARYASDGGAADGSGPVRASLQTQNDTTQNAGLHNHKVINMTQEGQHIHNLLIDKVGGGAAHSNIQPTMVLTIYIKL